MYNIPYIQYSNVSGKVSAQGFSLFEYIFQAYNGSKNLNIYLK